MSATSVVRAIVPLAGGLLALEHFGVDHSGRAIAVATAMVLAWLFESLHPAIVGFIGAFLFRAAEAAEFETAFGGFATSLPWLLFGVLLMASAAQQGGVARAVTSLLPRALTRSVSGASMALIVAGLALSWLMPQPLARAAILIIVAAGIAPPDTVHRSVLGGVAAAASVVFDTQVSGAAGIILVAGSAIALAAGAAVIARPLTMLDEPAEPRGSLDLAVMSILIVMVGLWITTPYHRLQPELVGLAGGLLCAIVALVRGWKGVTADPLAMILAGTALSMPLVLKETEAVEPLIASAHQVGTLLGLPASLADYWAWSGLRLFMLDAGAATAGASTTAWTLPAGAAATTLFALYQAPSLALAMATCGTRPRQVLTLGVLVFAVRSLLVLFL